jgi:CBS domain containing-hemolysin-like protein
MSVRPALEMGAILLIVGWNAFFVAAEYAFVTVRRTRLQELVEGGSRRARSVLAIVDDPAHFISAMQLGVTLSSLGLGAVAVPFVSELLRDGVGVDNAGVAGAAAVAVAFALVTALHVVLGEIVPKTIGLGRAEATALFVAGPVRLFFRLAHPFIWTLQRLARVVTRTIGVPEPSGMALVHSEDELKMLVSASGDEGVLEVEEQEMLHKVFGFSETAVEDVMVPRPDVVALPVTLTPAEALREVQKHPHTRYPVYGEDLDDIRGLCTSAGSTTRSRTGGPARPTWQASSDRPTSSRRPRSSASCSASSGARRITWPWSSTSTGRRRGWSRSRTCWRRSSARSTTSSTGLTWPSSAWARTASASRAPSRSTSSTSASGRTSTTRTT